MDVAFEKWKFCNPERKVDLDAYGKIRSSRVSHDIAQAKKRKICVVPVI